MRETINSPNHYKGKKYECIDIMLETQGTDATMEFCILNAFKYIYRFRSKNGLEDIKKAKWYIDKYIELANEIQVDLEGYMQ